MPQPAPERRPFSRTHHGDEREDEYAWLLDVTRSDDDVIAHLHAENAHTDEVLGHTHELQDALFEDIRRRVQETDLSVPRRLGPYWYYSRTVEGQQYPIFCRVVGDDETPPDPDDDGVRSAEEVLLDVNVEAGDREYYAVGVFDVSVDHSMLAWAFDDDGSERFELRFRDLATGVDRDDRVDHVGYGHAWARDGRSVLFTRMDEAWRPHQVWRHVLGEDPTSDELVLEEPEERFRVGVATTGDDRYFELLLQSVITTEVRLAPAESGPLDWVTVVPRRTGIEAQVDTDLAAGDDEPDLLILTNDGALDFRLTRARLGADPADWEDVVPHRPGVRLEGFDVTSHGIVVAERTEALTRLRLVTEEGETVIDQDEPIGVVTPYGHPDRDWPYYRYEFTSMRTPQTVVELDLRTGERHVRKVTPVLGGYDPDDYEVERLWATAPDGERIPISLLQKSGRQAPGPVVLYGYGSYEISSDPEFRSSRLALLDRGYAWAIAHVRGGGEMGRRWYESGKLADKPNTFTDFVAAAEALIDSGVAARGRIACWGGSAGGLLVGAAVNLAPDLFGAVVAAVPFVDALNTILDPSLPLTAGEWDEWGNPIEDPDIYHVMKGYSPYENVRSAVYPPILATAGLGDPRVGYWEPAKWIARLRDRAEGGPFLLRTEMGAGHGGRSGRYDAWRELAEQYAFVVDALGEGAVT